MAIGKGKIDQPGNYQATTTTTHKYFYSRVWSINDREIGDQPGTNTLKLPFKFRRKILFLFFKVSTDNQGGTEQHVVIKGQTKCLGCRWVFSCIPNGVQSVLFVRIQTRVPQASRHVYRSEFQTEVSKKHQDFLSIHLVLQYGDQFVGAQRSMIVRCVNVVLNHDKRILVKLIFPMINYMEFAINQKRL